MHRAWRYSPKPWRAGACRGGLQASCALLQAARGVAWPPECPSPPAPHPSSPQLYRHLAPARRVGRPAPSRVHWQRAGHLPQAHLLVRVGRTWLEGSGQVSFREQQPAPPIPAHRPKFAHTLNPCSNPQGRAHVWPGQRRCLLRHGSGAPPGRALPHGGQASARRVFCCKHQTPKAGCLIARMRVLAPALWHPASRACILHLPSPAPRPTLPACPALPHPAVLSTSLRPRVSASGAGPHPGLQCTCPAQA